MNDWKERFSWKISSIEDAIRTIPPGRPIFIGSGAGEPQKLVEGLVEHGTHLRNNEIVHLMTLGKAPYVAPGLEQRFRHMAFFIGANARAPSRRDGRTSRRSSFPRSRPCSRPAARSTSRSSR